MLNKALTRIFQRKSKAASYFKFTEVANIGNSLAKMISEARASYKFEYDEMLVFGGGEYNIDGADKNEWITILKVANKISYFLFAEPDEIATTNLVKAISELKVDGRQIEIKILDSHCITKALQILDLEGVITTPESSLYSNKGNHHWVLFKNKGIHTGIWVETTHVGSDPALNCYFMQFGNILSFASQRILNSYLKFTNVYKSLAK